MSQPSEFELLLPFFTPRTVFLHVGAGDGELALLAASYVERVYAIGVTRKFLGRPKLPVNLRFAWPRYGEVDVAFSAQPRAELAERIRETLGPDGKYLVLRAQRHDGWLSKLFPRARLVASIRQ